MKKEELVSKLAVKFSFLKQAEIEGLLYLLSKNKCTLEFLVTKSSIPQNTVSKFLHSIESILQRDGTFVTLKPFVQESFKFKKYKFTPFTLNNKNLTKKIKEIRNKYVLKPKRELDQFFATPKTSANKALILKKWGLLQNHNNIALIGDDDLASVALKLLNKNVNVTVFELDNDLISTLTLVSNKLELNIKVEKYDANKQFSTPNLGKFDAVLIDPPYTIFGTELFIDRAVSLLKKSEASYIFLNFGGSFKNPQKFLQLQNIFSKYKLVTEAKLLNFNKYFGAASIGSSSSLYILRATLNTLSLNIERNNIYTFQENTFDNFPYTETHIFKVTNVSDSVLKHFSAIDERMRTFCKKHSIFIKDIQKILYKNQGMTINYTLLNSSLAVHTWPEYRSAHIVLVTCKKVSNKNLMVPNLSDLFQTKSINYEEY